jgi:orotidine-5'-phosphate decarboxylase
MTPKDRIIFALDVPGLHEAKVFIDLLGRSGPAAGHVGAFKVGLELFMAVGPAILRSIKQKIMLDLKLHDIPETVERAVLRAGDLGVNFVTLHVQQRETLERAVRAAEKSKVQLLGVTVLTSVGEKDLMDLNLPCQCDPTYFDPGERVMMLAKFAATCGLNGFVCSPREVKMLRAAIPGAVLVIPGIRPAGTAAGDQKRTGTPAEAIKDGADYLVVGRPIRDAQDPVAAAEAIEKEISS